jgi:hypothetical protein
VLFIHTKNWTKPHAWKFFTSFAQTHVRTRFAQTKNISKLSSLNYLKTKSKTCVGPASRKQKRAKSQRNPFAQTRPSSFWTNWLHTSSSCGYEDDALERKEEFPIGNEGSKFEGYERHSVGCEIRSPQHHQTCLGLVLSSRCVSICRGWGFPVEEIRRWSFPIQNNTCWMIIWVPQFKNPLMNGGMNIQRQDSLDRLYIFLKHIF